MINAYDAQRNPFERWAKDGLLRYVDTTKAAPAAGSFLPRLTGLPEQRAQGSILTQKNLAGWQRGQGDPGVRFARSGARFRLPEFDRTDRAIESIQDRYNRWKQVAEAVRDRRVYCRDRHESDAPGGSGLRGSNCHVNAKPPGARNTEIQ